jgi:hypothetical protein
VTQVIQCLISKCKALRFINFHKGILLCILHYKYPIQNKTSQILHTDFKKLANNYSFDKTEMAALYDFNLHNLGKTINQLSPYHIGSLAFTVHECHQMVCLWICICLLYRFKLLFWSPSYSKAHIQSFL